MGGHGRSRLFLALIMAAALAARLGAAAWWQGRVPDGERFGFGDSESYWQLGLALAAGEPFRYEPADARVFRTPGYPVMLAAAIRLCGPSVYWARVPGAVLGACTVGGVYWLGRKLFNERAARFAALWAALYPGAVAMGGLVLTEAPFSALMVLQLALWVHCGTGQRGPGSVAWPVSTGLVAGAATLVRPSWLLFTPLAALCFVLFSPNRRRQTRTAALVLAGLALAMAPWWIRNVMITGKFVPTTLQVGASLYDGLNQHADGSSRMEYVGQRAEQIRQALPGETRRDTVKMEYQTDRALTRAAVGWAWQHPRRTIELAWTKFLRMWNIWPNEPRFRGEFARLLVLVAYVPLLLLGLAGAARFARRGWPYVLCALPAVYLTLLHCVFVSSLRYRQPALIALMVLAAGMLSSPYRDEHATQKTMAP